MIICKICNPQLKGNGYCAKHSTSGSSYLTSKMPQEIKEEIDKILMDNYDPDETLNRARATSQLLELFAQEKQKWVKEIGRLKYEPDETMSFRLGFREALQKAIELIRSK